VVKKGGEYLRKYIIVDKLTGNVGQTYQWGEDRDFPTNIELKENEEVITVEDEIESIDVYNTYDFATKKFYILDLNDKEIEISKILTRLSELDVFLSRVQEDTWTAMSLDETKLPQIWQDRLSEKRTLREKLRLLLV
jgi:hypothetical protein